jgi:hypothetical protein
MAQPSHASLVRGPRRPVGRRLGFFQTEIMLNVRPAPLEANMSLFPPETLIWQSFNNEAITFDDK